MGNYSINTIVFLINSFKDSIESFGRSTNTIEMYKDQVENMLRSNLINYCDKEIVYELLGILNTNNIKWTVTVNKISEFLYMINFMSEARTEDERKSAIKMFKDSQRFSDSTLKIVNKIFNKE